MILELIDLGWDKKRIVDSYVLAGMTEAEATFIYAIETGEIGGDVIEVDEDGNESYPDAAPPQELTSA